MNRLLDPLLNDGHGVGNQGIAKRYRVLNHFYDDELIIVCVFTSKGASTFK
ncbi:MAG: hypothetical protein ACJA2Y_001024 [Cycloclasticus pugetii]|jgi:hypothetical protein